MSKRTGTIPSNVAGRIGPLGEANFRRLWIGQTASAAGDGLTGVALTFAVLLISDSVTDLGIVVGAFMVPRVVFMLVGGVWADRVPRKRLMIASDLVRAVAQLAIAAAVFTRTEALWPYVAASLVAGTASAFFTPAFVGLVPQTISEDRLQSGNALLTISRSFASLFGPIAAGIAVALNLIGPLFVFDAATFTFSALMLARLTVDSTATGVRQRFIDDLAEGWHQVSRRPWLVRSLAAFAFVNLAFPAFFVLGPAIVLRDLGGAPAWGLIVALFTFGALVGAALALRFRPRRPLIATFSLLLILPASLVLLSFAPPLAILAGGAFVASAATTLADTIWHTTLQQEVPSEALSRVSSFDWTVSLMIFPLGAALVGPLAEALGFQQALLLIAVLAGVPAALVLLAPSVRAIGRDISDRLDTDTESTPEVVPSEATA
jgi:MFS family permease